MENTIKETTRLLIQGTLTKDEADKILLDLLVVSNSASDIEEKRDMEDFGNYAGIGFDDD
jgi:hypothetical protein